LFEGYKLTTKLKGNSRDCESESSTVDPDGSDDGGSGGIGADSFGNGGTKWSLISTFSTIISI